MIENKH